MIGPIRRALISVSDKTGLEGLAKALAGHGVAVVSTGGTARSLREWGVPVTDVSEVTGFPEIMDGRVKTLHPKIHGGLLGVRGEASHRAAMDEHAIAPIDLLVANLYPFEETVRRKASFGETIENIDVGGPAMIRAAAKNHASVTVVVSPGDYAAVLDEIAKTGGTTMETRRKLAAKAFQRTAAYDAAIGQWFGKQTGEALSTYAAFGGELAQRLRYGENPHQQGALYRSVELRPGVVTAQQLQGKELSYNNINDTDAAYECVAEFDRAACVIVKHANPCGVATGGSLAEVYRKALTCDPVSAFGGVLAFNRELDAETAEEIVKLFAEVIIAPAVSAAARGIIASKKNLRLLVAGDVPQASESGLSVKSIAGGLLVQTRDNGTAKSLNFDIVSKRKPTVQELADLRFAFSVVKHVKSNAIVYARDGATVGIGAGQMSRVDSARIAAKKGEDAARSAGANEPLTARSVAASDAFFPFPDGLLEVAKAGATAVVQPGGSLKDGDVIKAADDAGLAMVFTGMRHFRH